MGVSVGVGREGLGSRQPSDEEQRLLSSGEVAVWGEGGSRSEIIVSTWELTHGSVCVMNAVWVHAV